MSFLHMSLMGGAMILCVLLLRLLTRGRLPAAVLSIMWAAALLRLMLPLEVSSSLSIAGLFDKSAQKIAMTAPAQPIMEFAILSPLTFIWLCGAVLCAVFFLTVGIRQRRVLKTSLPAIMTPALKKALAEQLLPRPVIVYTSDRISTPLTYGLWKPRIVLPSHMALYGEELRFVIAHECAHIKRLDAAKKSVLLMAVCLHWFNPLVWLMAALCRRDMELACDRKVLKACGAGARALYARTLLNLEERKRFSGILMECFSRSPLEERIRSIMTGKKSTAAGVLAAVMVFFLTTAVFATSPGEQTAARTNTVFLSSTPVMSLDVRQAQAPEAGVYVINGNVLYAGQPLMVQAAPSVAVAGRASAGVFTRPAASVSLQLGESNGYVTVFNGQPASLDVLMPVYSTTYTVMEGVPQP